MNKLEEKIIELYKKAATSLPQDVEYGLSNACKAEANGSNSKAALSLILENIKIARETERPLCQDTGVRVFFVKIPKDQSQLKLKEIIIEATKVATEVIPLS